MTRLKLVTAALVLLGCIEAYALPPTVPPSYTLTDIGLLPGGYTRTWGNSIDAAGDVVGYCGGSNTLPDHAFRYHDGKLVDLGALFNPVLNTKALYTNVAGDVVLIQPSSTSTYPSLISSNEQPVLYRHGRFITIPFPRGATASVVGLNDFGQIAGNFTAGGALFAYIIERDGCLKILPTYAKQAISVQGITEFGQVYGGVQTSPVPTITQLITTYSAALGNFVVTPDRGSSYTLTSAEQLNVMKLMQYEFPALSASVSDAIWTSAYGPPVNLKTVIYGDGPTFTIHNEQTDYGSTGTYSIIFNNVGHFVTISRVISPAAVPVAPSPSPFPSYLPVLNAGNKKVNLASTQETNATGTIYAVTGINDFDTVTGYFISNSSPPLPLANWLPAGQSPNVSPFLYLKGTTYNPSNLILPVPAPGVRLWQLIGVNDAGQILALGTVNFTDERTFVLTPIGR